jgi:PAS domain S-box-containing protein
VSPSTPDAPSSAIAQLRVLLETAGPDAPFGVEESARLRELALRALDEDAQSRRRMRTLEEAAARSLQEIEEKILELSVLKQVGDAIASAIRQPDLLVRILDILVRELGAENGSIMRLDEASGSLTVWAGRGVHDDPRSPRPEGSAIPIGEGIAGWVAARREPLLVNDVSRDIRFVRRGQDRAVRGSLICIPLLGDARVLGVLNLSTSVPGSFGAHHSRVLGIVANQIASAIVGAELHHELQSFSGRLESEVADRTRELERKSEALHRKNDQVTDLYFSLERAQRELEERNAALVEALTFNDNIVESLHVGIGVVRHDGQVVSWNRAMGALTRGLLSKDVVLGRSITSIPEETRERFRLGAALAEALRDGIPFAEHGRVVSTGDGPPLHLDIRHLPVSIIADGETHVIIVIEDVTDAANLHESRVKAERLAAITETMVSVNHEVNNPLAVILGYAQILLDRLKRDDHALVAGTKAREDLARIESEALRIREITQKLASLVEPVVTSYPASAGVKMVDLSRSR